MSTEVFWLLGRLTVLVLALWLAVEILFQLREIKPATRFSHLADGGFLILFDLVWAGLCWLVCFSATWSGAGLGLYATVFGVGGAVFLAILWGAGHHFVHAFHDCHPRKSNPS